MAKRILMEIGGYYVGLAADSNSGVVVSALANAELFNADYCSNGPRRYKRVEGDGGISVSFVEEERFQPREETEKLLARDIEQSNKRWLDEYAKHNDTKKKLKEAEERIKSIGAA